MFSKLERLSRKCLLNKHRNTARKGWHLAALLSNKTVGSKIPFVGKKLNWRILGIPGLKRICLNKENTQRRRLRGKTNKIVNLPLERLSQPWKFFLPNPPPLLQISVDFVLHQEVQKSFLHFLHQSSEFYLRLQSSCFFRTDFHFKLIILVERVHN